MTANLFIGPTSSDKSTQFRGDWSYKTRFTENQIYKKPQELLAPVETASFFVIAMACFLYGSLPFVRNNKKDTVENGTELSEKIQFFCS